MVALATVLSLIKVIDMPYGGSVTLASMLPIIILSYRNGIGTGLCGGLVYAALQQLLGLSNLSYVTTWQSVLAVILLDYIVAFTVAGLGGIFRRLSIGQPRALVLGSLLVSLLRYICHTISGCTVWAGLSIPDSAALIYSIGYNATYMIPEAIILAAVAFYLGSTIDFTKEMPTRVVKTHLEEAKAPVRLLLGILALSALVADCILLFPYMQGESGQFDFSTLGEANWIAIGIITVLGIACIACAAAYTRVKKSHKTN